MDRINRVEKMEEILAEHRAVLESTEKALKEYEEHQKSFNELMDYYSSQDWFDDVEASNAGKIPFKVSQEVLSEDSVYDMYGENRNLALDFLKVATKVLSNE